MTCALKSCLRNCPAKCFKLDKTNGQTKWAEYNILPNELGDSAGRSFITTPKGVFAFGDGGIAFLPKGKKDWAEGPKLNNPDMKFRSACPVLISDSEIMLIGPNKSKKVRLWWTLNCENSYLGKPCLKFLYENVAHYPGFFIDN